MEKIVITEEMVRNAVSYAPIRMKEEFVEACYMRCLNKVETFLDDKSENPMPLMYMENTFAKSRFLMTALAIMYLGYRREDLEMVDGELWLMTEAEFDRWGMSHVIGQLNRFRNNNPELKDKVFDLLRDYGDLERRLTSAVRSGLHVTNDVTNRFFLKATMDMSSEALEEQRKQVEGLMEELKRNAPGGGAMPGLSDAGGSSSLDNPSTAASGGPPPLSGEARDARSEGVE